MTAPSDPAPEEPQYETATGFSASDTQEYEDPISPYQIPLTRVGHYGMHKELCV